MAVDTARHPNEPEHRAVSRIREALQQPPWPDIAYWGTTPEARRAAAAMAESAGGPAPVLSDEERAERAARRQQLQEQHASG